MEKTLIEYNIDNLDSNMLSKQDFLIENNISFTYVIEYSLKDINTIISNNYLFKKNDNLYVGKMYFNSKKINYNDSKYNTSDEYSFYIDSNDLLLINYNNFKEMYSYVSEDELNNNGYLYLEKIDNYLHNINDIYFYQLYAFMQIKNNKLILYLYNHDYYIVVNYSNKKYDVNIINGYFSFFTRNRLSKMRHQAMCIIASVIDIYGKYVENNNNSIDVWKFVFGIDKNFNVKLYDYNRYDGNINIFIDINENKNQYINNDILTNINGFINQNDINFVFLKKYNLL